MSGFSPSLRLGLRLGFLGLGTAAVLAACQPTVRVEAPERPIVINLNVKIEQEIRIKVERDVEDLFAQNQDLF